MTEQTPSTDRLSVFISYSRANLEFSDQLEKALQVTGFDTILDRHGISPGEDWRVRLGNLILSADTIVFVLSPDSAQSDVCKWEVEEAVRAGKRIIPVLCCPMDDAEPPHQLADLNYILFYPEASSPGSGFGSGLQHLVSALRTDLDWLREHTRLMERAVEWDAGARPANRLLSGPDISEAKAWLTKRPRNSPDPTALQLDYIKASEAEEKREQNEEARRLHEMAEAQAQRQAALDAQEGAQKAEADARRREARQARLVFRRTRIGLGAALALALVSVFFGWRATESERAQQEAAALAIEAQMEAEAAAAEAEKQRIAAQDAALEAEKQRNRATESAREAQRQTQETNKLLRDMLTLVFGDPGEHETNPIELATVELPEPLPVDWDKSKMVTRIKVHEKIACHLRTAFAKLHAEGLFQQLASFSGSYLRRKKRGSDDWSLHSWGIALDFDAGNNQLRWGADRARFARPEYARLHEIFEESGFQNSGKVRGFDWMQFEIRVQAIYDPDQIPAECRG